MKKQVEIDLDQIEIIEDLFRATHDYFSDMLISMAGRENLNIKDKQAIFHLRSLRNVKNLLAGLKSGSDTTIEF
jgi:hypothetical protein